MSERVVVTLHARPAAAGPAYLRRALAAKKRAEALGATLAAWGADTLAFDFGPEEIEEAIDLALTSFEDGGDAGGRFGAGVAFGELVRIGATGSFAMLAWGEPLVVAWALAQAAEPGEVLVDQACPAHLRQTLRMSGERRVEAMAHPALIVDARQPFRRDTLVDALHADSEVKVVVTLPPLPPLPGLARDLLDRPPFGRDRRGSEPPPTLRADRVDGSSSARPEATAASTAEELELAAIPSSEIESTPAELPAAALQAGDAASNSDTLDEDADLLAPVSATSAVPPPQLPPVRMAPSVPPPGFSGDLGSVPPLAASRISWPGTSEEYVELAAAARQALLKGNVGELERLSDELKTRGDHDDLAERMAGFVAWNRGAKAEGLRKLRAAADAETRPAHRVRALLAYGVALAASGRTDAALLAALGAIARAREVSDRQGEHVCARFLARLSAASGYHRAARTWAQIAEEVGAPRPA